MNLLCCFCFKKHNKKNKSNKKLPTTIKTSVITDTKKINYENDNISIISNNINQNVNNNENTDNNSTINTSIAAVTALSYGPSSDAHSYIVIDHTNVSSLEKDYFQTKCDSLQLYSLSHSTSPPSIHSNKETTITDDFKSAISVNSTESFFTTASSVNNSPSKNTSFINTNCTNNSILVDNTNDTSFLTSPTIVVNNVANANTNNNNTNNNNDKINNNDNDNKNQNNSEQNIITNAILKSYYNSNLNSNSVIKSNSNINSLSLPINKLKNNTTKNEQDTNLDINKYKNFKLKLKQDSEYSHYLTDITMNNEIIPLNIDNKRQSFKNNSSLNSNNNIYDTNNNNNNNNNNNVITASPALIISKGSTTLINNPNKPFTRNLTFSESSNSSKGINENKGTLNEYQLNCLAERALHPDLTDYTLDTIIKNRIKVYSRIRPTSGVNEYVILGYLDKVTLREAYDVYIDLEYRKEWDELKQQINIFEKKNNKKKDSNSSSNSSIKDFEIHWEVKLPWPFSNREYIFERNTYEHKYNDMLFLVADNNSLNQNVEDLKETENFKTIRITEYEQITVFYSDSENGKCNIYMEYYDDPKGNIPLILKNWVISRAAPNFIMNIEKACKEYKRFEKRLKNNKHIKELNFILGKSLEEAFNDFDMVL